MKNAGIIFFLLFLFCRPEQLKVNEDEVNINYGELGKRKYIWIYDEQIGKIQPGKTTIEELYKFFGKEISIRISFKPILPKLYRKGRYRPVDKIIMYFDGETDVNQLEGATEYKTKRTKKIVLFLYQGIVQFYSIGILHNNERWEIDPASTKDVKEFGTPDWPYVSCDRKFYETKILGWNPKEHLHPHYITAHDQLCYWEEPEFEKKLKKSGYYELLKDRHYGAKLECCKP
jgi:hypothetical protein